MVAGGEGEVLEAGWSRGDWIVALSITEEKHGWRDACLSTALIHLSLSK